MRSLWIGWEPRQPDVYRVAEYSARIRCSTPLTIKPIVMDELREAGLYTRPTIRKVKNGWSLWDVISEAPMATEFSISRFLTPILHEQQFGRIGWALFTDCDVLFRADLNELWPMLDPSKALMCVQHLHVPRSRTKMDGQVQTIYKRKNWSSVMAFNLAHPSNAKLTVKLVNEVPGRELHAFCWLRDHEIGMLPVEWNWLAGHSDPSVDPKIVHHTDGAPCLPGFENTPYADEWRQMLAEAKAGNDDPAVVSALHHPL